MFVCQEAPIKSWSIRKLAFTIVVEMNRVVRADDKEHELEETEDQESKDKQGVAIDPEDVTPPEDQEREDDEEH